MLFTASPQAYSSLGSEPAGPRSGECRTRTGAEPRQGQGRARDRAMMSKGSGSGPANAASPSHRRARRQPSRRLARGSSPTCSSRVACPGLSPHPSTTPLTFTGSGTGTSIGSSNASAPIARMPSLQNLMRRLPGWSTSAGIVLTSLIFGPTPEMPTASAAAFERSMKPIYAQGRSAICPEIPPATGFCRGSAPVTSPKVPQP